MKTNSIFFSISILFALSFLSYVCIAMYYMKTQPELQSLKEYNNIARALDSMLQNGTNLNEIQKYLKSIDFKEVKDSDIIAKARILSRSSPIPFGNITISIEKFKNDVFISIRTHNGFFLYRDSMHLFWQKYYIITFIGALIIIFIYIMTIKKLTPLIRLKQEIKKTLNSGEIKELSYKIDSNDEIGEVYNEFNKVMQTIASYSKSRSMFLRSIMHELKTPIAKGRIVAEMVGNEVQKNRLCSVFERLNDIINDFARLEEITSKHYKLEKKEFLITTLMDEVFNMLLINQDSKQVEVIHNNDLIKADFDLFALSVKNLIDNAIKYSDDHKAIVTTNRKDLFIKNKGDALKLNLDDYFEPFLKYNKNPSSHGFGLGMYIIKNALDSQNLSITYENIDGYNIFCIHECIVESFCDISKYKKSKKKQKFRESKNDIDNDNKPEK